MNITERTNLLLKIRRNVGVLMATMLLTILNLVMTSELSAQQSNKVERVEGQADNDSPLKYKFGGLLQIWTFGADRYDKYITSNADTKTSFLIKRAEIALSGSILDGAIFFTFMTDIARYPNSYTETGDRKSLPTQDLFIEYRAIPFINIKIGQFLKPITMESDQPSGDLFFIRRAMHTGGGTFAGNIAGTVQYGDQRDIGIMLNYQFGRKGSTIFEYKLGIFQGDSQNIGESNEHKSIAGKINLMLFEKILKFGISGQRDTSAEATNRDDRAGGHLLIHVAGLTAAFEYMQGWDMGSANTGIYGALLYDFKDSLSLPLQPGFRIDYFYKDDIDKNDLVKIYTFGLNYSIADQHARLQLNYMYVEDTTIGHQVALNTQISF
ncbi:MAG: hypothetical protein ABUK01_13480 [Leptospirales bacterium]